MPQKKHPGINQDACVSFDVYLDYSSEFFCSGKLYCDIIGYVSFLQTGICCCFLSVFITIKLVRLCLFDKSGESPVCDDRFVCVRVKPFCNLPGTLRFIKITREGMCKAAAEGVSSI